MLYSSLIGKIDKDFTNIKDKSASEILLGCGYIHKKSDGLYVLMPLGYKTVTKITKLISLNLENLNAQELFLTSESDVSLLKKSGREKVLKDSTISFLDSHKNNRIISSFNEEIVTDILTNYIFSIEDLPVVLYQYKAKFRESLDFRPSIIKAREYIVADIFSFHKSYTDLNNFFPKIHKTISSILEKLNINYLIFESDSSKTGGEKGYGFAIEDKEGSDIIIYCDKCKFSARDSVGKSVKESSSVDIRKSSTVKIKYSFSQKDLAAYFNVPLSKIGKTQIFKTNSGYVMTLVRADYNVSEEKLSKYLDDIVIKEASKKEISKLGFKKNWISVFENKDLKIIIDDALKKTENMILKSKDINRYIINANIALDFNSDYIADIVKAREGDCCLVCGNTLKRKRVMEIAKFIKINNGFSKKMGFCIKNKHRITNPYMGSFSIGIERLLLATIESNRDELGLTLPEIVAPYKFHLMNIGKTPRTVILVEEIYNLILKDCLYDDRKIETNIKENLSYLLGMPYVITVNDEFAQEDKFSVLNRQSGEKIILSLKSFKELFLEVEKGNNPF